MAMFNPPHPGKFIKATYLEPFNIAQNEMADKLGVAHSTFSRLIRGQSGISPEMAMRLSAVIGRSPESWMSMQNIYDLSVIKGGMKEFKKLKKFNFSAESISTILDPQ